METKEIIEGSKLIAKYMNLTYLPFSAELKEKGMKAGYYEVRSAEPVYSSGELKINMTPLRYSVKNGWKFFEGQYYKYVCRTHGDLRYWNSLDELVPVIKKIEREKVNIRLSNNGCHFYCRESEKSFESFDLPNWSNNTFKVIVEYLKTK
jgi:hypothetical protein